MAYTPTYITGAEVIAATSDSLLAAVTEGDLEAEFGAIHKAEVEIDRYCGYWDRFGGRTQTRLFPRVGDTDTNGNSTIPEPIKFATLYQIEHNFLNKPDIDHGIQNKKDKKNVSIISPRVKQILKGYVMKGGHVEFVDENITDWQ